MNEILDIKKKPMGVYETNCYIVCCSSGDIIIDPGVDALKWIKQEANNPVAVLNTHGHFDHVWSNTEVKEHYNIPLYCPKGDEFMLQDTTGINYNVPHSFPDVLIEADEEIILSNNKSISYIHLPGHTPGTNIIIIDDYIFSGDFVFNNCIGRVDFPYSSSEDMKKSIAKFISLDLSDKIIFPGHGENTSLYVEQDRISAWITRI